MSPRTPASHPAPPPPRLVVVGSVGLDSIETAEARCEEALGGSAVYACAAASFFARTGMVGIVGEDFRAADRRRLERLGLDLRGLQTAPGRTFRWWGVYDRDMNNRSTRETQLNVFAHFEPALPAPYRAAPFVFLGNIAPALQRMVLAQISRPRLVMADTMDMWIRETPGDLNDVLRHVDIVAVNESEARHLSGEENLFAAARRIRRMGPSHVLVKKGEHGAFLLGPHGTMIAPAYPVERVRDPTGAGDAFAGGFMGALAAGGRVTPAALRRALTVGTVMASFIVEAFSLRRLERADGAAIRTRMDALRAMVRPG